MSSAEFRTRDLGAGVTLFRRTQLVHHKIVEIFVHNFVCERGNDKYWTNTKENYIALELLCNSIMLLIVRKAQSIQCQAFYPVVRIGSPPPSHLQESVASPLLVPSGEAHSLAWEGVGGPNSDEGTDTSGTLGVLKSLYSKTLGLKINSDGRKKNLRQGQREEKRRA